MSKMPRQRGRWSQPTSSIEMTVKSMLDLRQLESFSVSRSPSRDSLSQNSNGDDREEHNDLPVHTNKVRAGGGPTLTASVCCCLHVLLPDAILFIVKGFLNDFQGTSLDNFIVINIPAMCDSAVL